MNRSGNFWLKERALLIVWALFCLCVSDSAGPRLLPLPNLSESNFRIALNRGIATTRTPSPAKDQSPYIEMLAGSQYRTRDYNNEQIATHSPQGDSQLCCPTLTSAPATYAPFKVRAPSLSISNGRAPPRLI